MSTLPTSDGVPGESAAAHPVRSQTRDGGVLLSVSWDVFIMASPRWPSSTSDSSCCCPTPTSRSMVVAEQYTLRGDDVIILQSVIYSWFIALESDGLVNNQYIHCIPVDIMQMVEAHFLTATTDQQLIRAFVRRCSVL